MTSTNDPTEADAGKHSLDQRPSAKLPPSRRRVKEKRSADRDEYICATPNKCGKAVEVRQPRKWSIRSTWRPSFGTQVASLKPERGFALGPLNSPQRPVEELLSMFTSVEPRSDEAAT